ncbi:hypothetical protein V6N13_081223 [Hibiscus sabdariffa]|uniref:Uncharacterized protein n=1 Tax=Hibiscus sabdariffa TaxID=183260 RepID=A0ABR2P9A5_9ROSI
MAVPLRLIEDDEDDDENALFEEDDYDVELDDEPHAPPPPILGDANGGPLPLGPSASSAAVQPDFSLILVIFQLFGDHYIQTHLRLEKMLRNTADLFLILVPGADLTNYLQLPQDPSWLQGGLCSQDSTSRIVHIATYLIKCILAVAQMIRFNADLISSAVPGADFTNYPQMPETPSWFQGGPGTPPVNELCDHFESYCYESHVAYSEMLRFTIGLISIVFPGFDVPVSPVVLPSDWLQRFIKLL